MTNVSCITPGYIEDRDQAQAEVPVELSVS
jgi:hypothetical protein